MMLAITAALIYGFARSPLLPGRVWDLEPFFYFHSAVMFAWMLLFSVQVGLVSARNVKLHRTLGTIAFALIPIIAISGVPAAMISGGRLGPAGQPPVDGQLNFMGTLFLILVMFTGYAGLGMAWRRDAQRHKRLMLLAAIVLVEVAVFRWPFAFLRTHNMVHHVTELFLLPVIAWDLLTRRRLHPVTLWGGAAFLVYGIVTPTIVNSAWWLEAGRWMVTKS